MKPLYKHTKAQIFNYSFWIGVTDPIQLKTTFERLLKQSGFTIITFHEHHFTEQGYTCFWLLAESHLAIHTFPEDKKSYIELSSCNQEKLGLFKNDLNISTIIEHDINN